MFEVRVVGAKTKEDAVKLSKSVACSNLTKTAIAGHDANWGRIICAMGYSGVQFDPEKVDLFFESSAGKIQIAENGVALDFSEEKATEILSQSAVTATADVKMGSETATAESSAGKIQIAENGVALDFSEEKATEILSQSAVTATADVKMGSETATAWGCDLTHGYIEINADYRS